MKDTIDRPARCSRVRQRSSVEGSCCRNSDADRIAYVAFVTLVNWTDEGKAAQGARDVTQAEEDAYEAASGVDEDAVSEPTDAGVWRQS